MTFSENVATTHTDGEEPQLLFYSPGSSAWFDAETAAVHAPQATVRLIESNSDADCTIFIIIGQPTYLTAADPFQTGVQVPIT